MEKLPANHHETGRAYDLRGPERTAPAHALISERTGRVEFLHCFTPKQLQGEVSYNWSILNDRTARQRLQAEGGKHGLHLRLF